jgi:hypothetical protein
MRRWMWPICIVELAIAAALRFGLVHCDIGALENSSML